MPRTWWPVVRALNRLEFVTETLRAALEALAVAAPGWLAEHDLVSEAWVGRYGARARLLAATQGRGGAGRVRSHRRR